MFSVDEKKKIAAAVENVLLEINHPEMPKEKPNFELYVAGAMSWSFANIVPNWKYEEAGSPVNPNGWNEVSRKIMREGDIHA